MSLPAPLIESIHTLARELPPGAISALVEALGACEAGEWSAIRTRTQSTLAHPHYREQVSDFVREWADIAPQLPPSNVGAALQAAAYCVEATRREQSLELVWTGPQTEVALRRTDQALLQVIDSAREELIVVAFAVYHVPQIRAALVRAIDRGVRLWVIIESPKESEGKVIYDGLISLGPQVAARARVFRWPLDKRPGDSSGKKGSLHVKCAVADGAVLLLSSANLTEYALYLNMEMGVLVKGGNLPQQVARHFRRLVSDHVLVPLGR